MARGWPPDREVLERSAEGKEEPPGVFYCWKGERPIDPNAPALEGTGEIRMESAERASGYFVTRVETHPKVSTRTSGVYLRADPEDLAILDGRDDRKRVELIAERVEHWKGIKRV